MPDRFCTSRRCKRRLHTIAGKKGRCTACGSITTRLKYPPQTEAAEKNRLVWIGNKLIIKS